MDIAETRLLKVGRDDLAEETLYDVVDKNWPEKPHDLSIQQLGFEFFEEFSRALSSYSEFKQTCLDQEQIIRREELQVEPVKLGFNPEDMNLNQNELEQLYMEALYTIKHKIGCDKNVTPRLQFRGLNKYVESAFGCSDQEHSELLQRSVDAKPPVVVLEVEVLRGRDLQAKDADGFSDPYCMLGIVPTSSRGGEGVLVKNSSLTSGLPVGDFEKIRINCPGIPAKFIKTTSVKCNNLNPIWNEKFRFDLDDVKTDKLHLDMWDRDDDFSVVESAKKLNKVRGIKGLSRYFKQIAQSARSNTDDSVDDFMGMLQINLRDISSDGLRQWFDLYSRSNPGQKVNGQIELQLSLATREDVGQDEEDVLELMEMRQHKNLISIFMEYEYRLDKEAGRDWKGELSDEAKLILHQHALQGDISKIRRAICFWLAIGRQFCKTLFKQNHLINSLWKLEQIWQPDFLYREDEEVLAESLEDICTFLIRLIDHAIEIGQDVSVDFDTIEMSLETLSRLYDSKILMKCLPFKKSLKSELISLIKKIYSDSYDRLHRVKNMSADESEYVSKYCHFIRDILITLFIGKGVYNLLFIRVTTVDFFRVAYKETHKLLSMNLPEDLNLLLQNENRIEIGNGSSNITGGNYDSCVHIFKLFLLLRRFYNLAEILPKNDQEILNNVSYLDGFRPYLVHWVNIIDDLLTERLKIIDQHEKVEKVEGDVFQSSLAIDVAYCFGQVVRFWLNLRWPDNDYSHSEESFSYRIAKILSEGAKEVSELIIVKLKKNGYYDIVGQFDISEKLCISLNNLEQVRRAYLNTCSCLSTSSNSKRDLCIEHLMKQTDHLLSQGIKNVVDIVADKMRPDIQRFVFRLCWTPEAASPLQSIGNLMTYLDSNLSTVNSHLLRNNFNRILESIWNEVLEVISENILKLSKENNNEGEWVPKRLYLSLKLLFDFFHSDGKGLNLEALNCSAYRELETMLKAMQMTNEELIAAFYQQKLKLQSEWNYSKVGTLCYRARHSSDSLFVEILSAKKIAPMDSNGSSDPFVIVELGPRYLFKSVPSQLTKIVKKSLNPVFNESFVFPMTKEEMRITGASLVFILMDHDLLTSNDFAGEAYVSLSSLGHGSGESNMAVNSGIIPTTISFMQGTELSCNWLVRILNVLKMRQDSSPMIADFLRRKADTVPKPT